jgi:hypothetical protein
LKSPSIIITVIVTSFFSCYNRSDGGHCRYETRIIPATLVKLVDINSQSYDAQFEADIDGKIDTFSYARLNNGHYLFTETIPKDSLLRGKQYQFIRQRIISGTCSPKVDIIVLKPYNNP